MMTPNGHHKNGRGYNPQPITAAPKLRGGGGHLTAAILHQVHWYDHLINTAKKSGDRGRAADLMGSRRDFVAKHRDILQDRGYYGRV